MAEPSTTADLRRAGVISSQEVVEAIDAYLLDPTAGSYRFASGHSLDIAAAGEGHTGFRGRGPIRTAGDGVPDGAGRRRHVGASNLAVTLGRSAPPRSAHGAEKRPISPA